MRKGIFISGLVIEVISLLVIIFWVLPWWFPTPISDLSKNYDEGNFIDYREGETLVITGRITDEKNNFGGGMYQNLYKLNNNDTIRLFSHNDIGDVGDEVCLEVVVDSYQDDEVLYVEAEKMGSANYFWVGGALVGILLIIIGLILKRKDVLHIEENTHDEVYYEASNLEEELKEFEVIHNIEDEESNIIVDKKNDEFNSYKKEDRQVISFIPQLHRPRLKKINSSIKRIIPNYSLTHKIGSGGTATVYQALNENGEKVAIKLPKFLDETVSSSILEEFKAEAAMWKKLTHKNIVRFYEGDIQPVPYLVIELMEGGNLKQLIDKHRLTVKEAKDIMLQILDGLSYAHKMASVHRDIKPENILFTKEGIPKISDWGIGKFMASEGATKTVGTKGTLLYSAPEQISKKKFGDVDWRTDVFQLGIVFYEMLTGVNPFHDEDSAGIVGNVLYEKVDPPSRLNPEIPRGLETIVMKALEKRKEDRWSSAEVMYHELKRLVGK